MTTPPSGTSTEEPTTTGPRVTGEQMRDLGRLRRSSSERKVAGVAGGIARHLDIDPLLVRIVLVVLVFFGGAGIILYGAGWLLLPDDDPDDRPMIPLDDRSRAVALWIAAGLAAVSAVGDSVGGWDFPWPAAPVAIVAVVVLSRRRHRHWGPPARPPRDEPEPEQPTQESWSYEPEQRWETWSDRREDWRRPRDPRRRGPILFGFTVALAALAVGVLITAHLAGADIPPSAYPATVAATCGLMLLVSAFYGRGGGLLLVGLVAALAMVVTSGNGNLQVGRRSLTPTSAAAVADSYGFGVGELRLDLTGVDPAELGGRTIHLQSHVGRILVIVPDHGVDVEARGEIGGGGETVLFGDRRDHSASDAHDGGAAVATLTIDADLTFGQIEVTTEETR